MRYLILILLFVSCQKSELKDFVPDVDHKVKFLIEGDGDPFQTTYKNEYGATITPVGQGNNWQGLSSGWFYEFTCKSGEQLYFKAFKGTANHMKATMFVDGSIVKQGECDGHCEQILTYDVK